MSEKIWNELMEFAKKERDKGLYPAVMLFCQQRNLSPFELAKERFEYAEDMIVDLIIEELYGELENQKLDG